MHRINTAGATADNRFTNGDPASSIPCTIVDATWLNSVQEELIAAIVAAGLTPSAVNDGQLGSVITTLLNSLSLKAPLLSPTFTGTPTAPTPAISDASTKLATTEFVQGILGPGHVAYFGRSSAPTGYLKCNGATVSRTTYAALFAAIGTTFGAGDGSTNFALPDLRGEFIRGLDDSRGVDTGRTLGSAQADDFKSHVHSVGYGSAGSSIVGFGMFNSQISTANIGSAGGTETRPRNVALLACIKY